MGNVNKSNITDSRDDFIINKKQGMYCNQIGITFLKRVFTIMLDMYGCILCFHYSTFFIIQTNEGICKRK